MSQRITLAAYKRLQNQETTTGRSLAEVAAAGELASLRSSPIGNTLRVIAEAAVLAQGKAQDVPKAAKRHHDKGAASQEAKNGQSSVFAVTLPVPPSLNNAYKNVKRGRVLTPEAKGYKEGAKMVIEKAAILAKFSCSSDTRLALSLKLYFSSNHRRDISNCAKLPEDALAEVLGFDDCRVDRLVVERGENDAKFPRCEILLEVIS